MTFTNLLDSVPSGTPDLYDSSWSIKVMEVAKKYEQPEVCTSDILPDLYWQGKAMLQTPEYTMPGGPNSYVCTDSEWQSYQCAVQGLNPAIR